MATTIIYIYDVVKDGSGSCKVNCRFGVGTSPDTKYDAATKNSIPMNGVILKYYDDKVIITYTAYDRNPVTQIFIQRGNIDQECICKLKKYSLTIIYYDQMMSSIEMTPTIQIQYATNATSELQLCPSNGKIVIDNLFAPPRFLSPLEIEDTDTYQSCDDQTSPVPVNTTGENPISCSIS